MKPTIENVIDAALEKARSIDTDSSCKLIEACFQVDDLKTFASYWYEQGLLDAAEKCDELYVANQYRLVQPDCAFHIRQIAKESK